MMAKNTSGGSGAVNSIERRVNWTVLGSVIGLLVIAALGIIFAFRFVNQERGRELQAWQIRLGIVADSRAAAVNEWVEQNFAALRELAQNTSLQLYMTELDLAGGDRTKVTDEAAQAGYMRNLLTASAERTGFKPPISAGEVNANVERAGTAGIGIADKTGRALISTQQMPPVAGRIREAVAKALEGEPAVIDVFMGASNLPTMGFVLPIYGIQDGEGSKGIGAVVGVRIIGDELFRRLNQPGATEQTAETYLARKDGNSVQFISPLADGTPPLQRALVLETPGLADALAVEKPGGFIEARDYAGNEVLLTSRAIAGLPWILVRKVNRAEALAATETRLKTILTVFVLIIIGVGVTIIAVWRHGTSVRAAEAAERFRISSERFENISKFMRLVTDSQPNLIVAVDGTTTFTFSNEPAAKSGGISASDMIGKKMASVLGPVKAKALAEINDRILRDFAEAEAQGLPDSRERCRQSNRLTFETEQGVEVIQSDHIPLRGDRDHPPGVLMVLSDITELTQEKRKSDQLMGELINTLVSVVDRRDPFAARRSNWTAAVAVAVARDMGLSEPQLKATEIGAALRNLGSIFVPTAVLQKPEDKLTAAERDQLGRIHVTSADLLKDVPFDVPVVEAVRQSGERPDGSGPLGLRVGQIGTPASIIAVADAFVHLVSPRADHEGATFESAVATLLQGCGTAFERKPVSALINHLDNRGGAEDWAHFRIRPSAGEELRGEPVDA